MKDFVIKVLNLKHGQKVKEYFHKLGINTNMKSFTATEDNKNTFIYYGRINGYFDNYNIETVKINNIPIITIDNVSPKEFPRKMLVWHQDERHATIRWVLYIIPDKNCKNPIVTVSMCNEASFEKGNNYCTTTYKNAKEVPEITPLQKEFNELQTQIKDLQEKANEIQKKL